MSKGPHTRDDHYVYGKPTAIRQPYPAYYNSSWYHRKPPRRFLSDMVWFMDDGSSYIIDNRPSDPNGRINRSLSKVNIINIETVAVHSLRIKLYGATEEDDTDITLELGKKYDIMYITEGGLTVARGILKIIDSAIPDTCTRYIGEFNSLVNTAYIGMDCSTEGNSDKRKIYIASIRAIQEIIDEETEKLIAENDLTDSDKLDYMMSLLPGMDEKIDKLLNKLAVHDKHISNMFKDMNLVEKIEYLNNALEKSLAGVTIEDITYGEKVDELERDTDL